MPVKNQKGVNCAWFDSINALLILNQIYRQLRAREGIAALYKDVLLRPNGGYCCTYKHYGDNTLLILNRTLLNSVNSLLALSRRYVHVYNGPYESP